jgi:alcohol dehydrogenase class IV
MRFEFATANRIIFGEGAVSELPSAAAGLGSRALFVTGSSVERSAAHRQAVSEAGLSTELFCTHGEPTVAAVLEGLDTARSHGCDLVIALGGGSALDAGKAIAGLLPNPGEIHDYLEVVGKGGPLPRPAVPFIAVPTTAGTGSEVTRNAVLSVPESGVKVSLRHASMLAKVAIVDPQLTYDLPPGITASAGLDALVQLIEPFVSVAANPMVDVLCRDGIRRIARSLRRAWRDGSDAEARADMSFGALLSGMALANAKLGAVHGFAGPLGGRFAAPHGAVCARLLPGVVQTNIAALRERAPQSQALSRFAELSTLLTGQESAPDDAAVAWLMELCHELAIPPLSRYGMKIDDFRDLIQAAVHSSSMKGNPITLTEDELNGILQSAM